MSITNGINSLMNCSYTSENVSVMSITNGINRNILECKLRTATIVVK